MDSKPKPCPFCGAKDDGYNLATERQCGSYYVLCNECVTTGPEGETEEEAIEQWNTRPAEEAK